MNNDSISREALKEEFKRIYRCAETIEQLANNMEDAIDNAPNDEIATKLQPNCNNLQPKQGELKEYKPLEPDYNIQCAVENLRAAYWSNEPEKVAKNFTEAEDKIISAICHHGYVVCKQSEQSQGKWIPVSERLPDNRDWYLGVFKEPDTDFIGIPYICDYVGEVTKGTTNEGWILRHCTDVDTVPDYFRNLICVAWQPLPEPYKKGGAV